jgi:hypothetical protein
MAVVYSPWDLRYLTVSGFGGENNTNKLFTVFKVDIQLSYGLLRGVT